jgi:hypothetical protein
MSGKLDLGAPPANDNAWVRGRPIVRTPRGRSRATYAASENLLLPVAFARRMPGWERTERRFPFR